jgi:electron transport complex protein RnfG
MKVVFNFVVITLIITPLLGTAPAAWGEARYFTTKSLLKELFPDSDKVGYEVFTPTRRQRAALRKRLGYRLARKRYVFYVATTGTEVDGYAFIDDQMGQHQPITFAVMLSPDGAVLRQEVVTYREQRGGEIRDERFRKQFVGKTVDDPISADDDIDCVSGATISSRAIAVGVRRAVVLFDEFFGGRESTVSRAAAEQ